MWTQTKVSKIKLALQPVKPVSGRLKSAILVVSLELIRAIPRIRGS